MMTILHFRVQDFFSYIVLTLSSARARNYADVQGFLFTYCIKKNN